jgi:hypothetical protein
MCLAPQESAEGLFNVSSTTVKCQYNEIVRVKKLYSLQRNFVALKHIKNGTQMFALAI